MLPFHPKRHHDLCDSGWHSGDAHNHIHAHSGNSENTTTSLIRYCAQNTLSWLFVCQPWLISNAKRVYNEIPQFTTQKTDKTLLSFGAEFPKTRYSHTWWLNLEHLTEPLANYTDNAIEEYYATPNAEYVSYPFEMRSLCNIWREYMAKNALPVHAHPTSWWPHEKTGTHVTNCAAILPVAALTGMYPLAMVVQGYDADHIFYQNMWFELLNKGYRITAMAESDGSLPPVKPHFAPGAFRTYLWTGKPTVPSAADIVHAVACGRTCVSSGPFISLSLDTAHPAMGHVYTADNSPHCLTVTALASPLPGQGISHVVLYRNGTVFAHENLSSALPRTWQKKYTLHENTDAWYAAKCYGMYDFPVNAIDPCTYARQCIATGNTTYAGDGHVALTSPLYFRTDPTFPDPEPIRVAHPLSISEIRELCDTCVTGAWRKEYPNARPGQLPWNAFHYDSIQEELRIHQDT